MKYDPVTMEVLTYMQMVYCYEKEHPDYGSVTNNNASSSSNTTSQKKYHSNSGSGSTSKHKYVYTDPYDAEDYNDADDFAEDWAEEFGDGDYDDGYDDAYDYWEDALDQRYGRVGMRIHRLMNL